MFGEKPNLSDEPHEIANMQLFFLAYKTNDFIELNLIYRCSHFHLIKIIIYIILISFQNGS